MKKELNELVFILDRSGSMAGLEDDTIGGFNSFIDTQRQSDKNCLVSTVLFNNQSTVIYDRVALDKIRKMERSDYIPGGTTALIDAMGDAIKHIKNVHKYIREEDVPEHTIFVIITDGQENDSHKFSSDEVKKMVAQQKEKGWEFLFLGANIDAVETAKSYGIDETRSVEFLNDSIGIKQNFKSVAKAVSNFMSFGSMEDDWACEIEEDYKKRKK